VKFSRKQVVIGGIAGAGIAFALFGGQYSTLDLLRQKSESEWLQAALDSLQREIDSLERYKKSLSSDAMLQERIARELWGMSREGEIVYRFEK
jgi:cell division protein FtsB